MTLYYIHLGLDYDDYIQTNNILRYEFQQRTNFIDDYFSKKIRKLKFKTDGTFNMISISPTEFEIKSNSIVPENVLEVNLPFEPKKYEKIKGTEDCNYYLELLENGFKKASELKTIPLDNLLSLIVEFRNDGCKNQWIHKKKRSKESDIEVILICDFTTNYFQLWLTVNEISTKKELINEVIIRTKTGNSIHEKMFKNILIDDDDIIITDNSDSPRIAINKQSVLNQKLEYKIIGDTEIKEILTYELNN